MRIATYNIEADIGVTNKQPTFTNIVASSSVSAPLPGLIAPVNDPTNVLAGGVIEGIGEEIVNGNAQPLDILSLEETTSNPSTVAPIVNGLNSFYAAHNVRALYTNSAYQATESGGDVGDGNGPNAIIFNTFTVQLLASVPVDPPSGAGKLGSSSGEYREVMRYEFAPAGVATNSANIFFIYVSHYKSGTGSSNEKYRGGEAQIVRSNMMTLPSTARILHVGDFNTGVASEPMFLTLTAPGTNFLIDPLNPTANTNLDFDGSSGVLSSMTEEDTYLEYRDDYQMMTTNVYYGSGDGLKWVAGTFHVFGNSGATAYRASVNSISNTALTNLIANPFISAAQILLDLTGASDHLPVVADYSIPVPAPVVSNISSAGTNLSFVVVNAATNGVYILSVATNLLAQNWQPMATNISPGSSFTFTLTNAVNANLSAQFFRLEM